MNSLQLCSDFEESIDNKDFESEKRNGGMSLQDSTRKDCYHLYGSGARAKHWRVWNVIWRGRLGWLVLEDRK